MKTLLIILLVTAVLSAILRILRKKHSGHNHPDQLYEVPAGMATQHAAKLLPMIGSEDMSHLLVQLNLAEEVDDNMDSLLNPLVYWVIDLEFRPDVVLKRSDILRAYDQAWFKKFKDVELDIYGYAPELNEWTFVRATGVPEGFTGIRFGVKLFDPIIEPPHRLTRSYLEQILTSIQMQGNTLGLISVRPTIQVEEAAEKSEQLFNIWQE